MLVVVKYNNIDKSYVSETNTVTLEITQYTEYRVYVYYGTYSYAFIIRVNRLGSSNTVNLTLPAGVTYNIVGIRTGTTEDIETITFSINANTEYTIILTKPGYSQTTIKLKTSL
ncbi:MAG: hypothetical protein QXR39_09370 [Candidatus Methanomethylicia archaeon]